MAPEVASTAANGYQLPFEKEVGGLARQIAQLEAKQAETGHNYSSEIRQLRATYVSLLRTTYQNLTAWQVVQVARHPLRPQSTDYIQRFVRDFAELHGDRRFADD